jgi:hypothetical protein
MPLALLTIGVIFLIAAVRGTHQLLFDTLKDDFTGPNNFIYWGLALFVISAAGYYKPLRPLSNAFMLLVVLVLFLSNRGFFERFMQQIGATRTSHPHEAPAGAGGPGLVSAGADVLSSGAQGFATGGPIGGIAGAAKSLLSHIKF